MIKQTFLHASVVTISMAVGFVAPVLAEEHSKSGGYLQLAWIRDYSGAGKVRKVR
jgi:hypothetical protein